MQTIWLVVCLALTLVPARALDPGRRLSQYGHTAWHVRDGAFPGGPHVITQTADGYLWIGTEGGLVRFDGVRFVRWADLGGKPLRSSSVYSLLPEPDGGLLIGSGAGVERWANGKLAGYGKPLGRILRMARDGNGDVWIVRSRTPDSEGALCRISGSSPQCYGPSDGIPMTFGTGLAIHGTGEVWSGNGGQVCRWKSGTAACFPNPRRTSDSGLGGVSLAAASDGTIFAGFVGSGEPDGVRVMKDGVWRALEANGFGWPKVEPTSLMMDRSGAIWVGTAGHGVYRIHEGKADRVDRSGGLSGDYVEDFFQDREGNIWVTTSQGIDQFHDLSVVTVTKQEGLSSDQTGSVLARRDGSVWVGNNGAFDVIRGTAIEAQAGLPGRRVTSMFEDRDGRLWAGIDGSMHVYERGRFQRIPDAHGADLGVIVAMAEDQDGDVWVLSAANAARVRRLFRTRKRKVIEETTFPAGTGPRSIAGHPKHGVFMLGGGALSEFRDGQFRALAAGLLASSTSIADFVAGADESLWISTLYGIVGWKDGQWAVLDSKNGLPCDEISTSILDSSGSLWLQSACGIVVISPSELARWRKDPGVRVQFRTYGILDGGLPAGRVPFSPRADQSSDGRLWFVTETVVQTVDPSSLRLNTAAPPVQIEGLTADRKGYPPRENLDLPALTRDIEIDFTALSFSIPQKVRFRYMLEGRDADWRDAVKQRQANYNDLPPATYRFRVVASNNDGVWNEAGATMTFRVAPAYSQTAWFRALAVALFISLCWTLYRFRVGQIAAGITARFDERMAERIRIARELHDTLLQTIQASKLVADTLLDSQARGADTRPALERISRWLLQATHEGRAALTSLRESAMQENDLAESLRHCGEEAGLGGSMMFDFKLEGDSHEMHPIVRDDVNRIGIEAIRNAFSHSGGTRVEVQLTYGRDLALRVRDNGKGIDPGILSGGKPGHYGLKGMQERAERAGCKLTLRSLQPGTEVELVVPGNLAFRPLRAQSLRAKVLRGWR